MPCTKHPAKCSGRLCVVTKVPDEILISLLLILPLCKTILAAPIQRPRPHDRHIVTVVAVDQWGVIVALNTLKPCQHEVLLQVVRIRHWMEHWLRLDTVMDAVTVMDTVTAFR